MYLRNCRRLYSEEERCRSRTIKIIYVDTRYDEEHQKIWKNVKRRITRENRVGWVDDDVKYLLSPFRFFGGPIKKKEEHVRRFQL